MAIKERMKKAVKKEREFEPASTNRKCTIATAKEIAKWCEKGPLGKTFSREELVELVRAIPENPKVRKLETLKKEEHKDFYEKVIGGSTEWTRGYKYGKYPFRIQLGSFKSVCGVSGKYKGKEIVVPPLFCYIAEEQPNAYGGSCLPGILFRFPDNSIPKSKVFPHVFQQYTCFGGYGSLMNELHRQHNFPAMVDLICQFFTHFEYNDPFTGYERMY